MTLDRRDMLGRMAASLVFAGIGGNWIWTTPARAAAADATLRVLSKVEGAWIAALGEAIAPPSRAAGLVHYIDHHLAVPHAESLLAVRYIDALPPYIDFYRAALASLARLYGETPPTSGDPRWKVILKDLGNPTLPEWKGPPAPAFFFVFRLDAIDIAYGTVEAFERLGIDYLPHVLSETPW